MKPKKKKRRWYGKTVENLQSRVTRRVHPECLKSKHSDARELWLTRLPRLNYMGHNSMIECF